MVNCRLCNKQDIGELFTLDASCPDISHLPEKPTQMAARELKVYQCEECGLVQLAELCVNYDDYIMTATHSSQMKEYMENLACSINYHVRSSNKKFDKENKPRLLEVGCGDGEFLEVLARNFFDVSAVEPSKTFFALASKKPYPVYNAYLTKDNPPPGAPYDVIVAREVLEHIFDFHDFLNAISEAIAPKGTLVIQVPRLENAIENFMIQTFFTDHVNYFSEETLRKALELHGFRVEHCAKEMGGEYTVVYACKENVAIDKAIFQIWQSRINRLSSYIDSCIEKGDKVALWGAGGKGISNLAAMKLKPRPSLRLVDCDPHKIGRYTPVTNFLIEDSKTILEANISSDWPDVIIVLADAYRQEILKKIHDIGYTGKIVLPDKEFS